MDDVLNIIGCICIKEIEVLVVLFSCFGLNKEKMVFKVNYFFFVSFSLFVLIESLVNFNNFKVIVFIFY